MDIARRTVGKQFEAAGPLFVHSWFLIKKQGIRKYAKSCFLSWVELTALIFSRSNSFIFFEGADKIAQVIETVSVGDFRDGIVRGCQLAAGLFNPLAVQVIHGSLMSHLGKEPAEIEIQISMSVLFYQKKHCDFQGIWI